MKKDFQQQWEHNKNMMKDLQLNKMGKQVLKAIAKAEQNYLKWKYKLNSSFYL